MGIITVRPAGLAFPVTPKGESSILQLWTQEPSHRLVGDWLTIAFESDPDVVREYVPKPLELDRSGLVYLIAFDCWGYTDRNLTEFISPERVNFTEALLYVPCSWKGEEYLYCPFAWVNRDYLAYFGRLVGMPQKLGRVQMTRFHPADSVYNEPHEGVRICLSVENVGLVLRAYVHLQRREKQVPFWSSKDYHPRIVGRRYLYDVVKGQPVLDDLIVHWAEEHKLGPIWGGDAWLRFYEAENEETIRFQPRRVVGGWLHTYSGTHGTQPPEVLHDFLPDGRGGDKS